MRLSPSQKTETTFNIGEVLGHNFAFNAYSISLDANTKPNDYERDTLVVKRIFNHEPFTILDCEIVAPKKEDDYFRMRMLKNSGGFKIKILFDNQILYTEMTISFFKQVLYKIA